MADHVDKSRSQLGRNRGHGVKFGQFVQEGTARVAITDSKQFLETIHHGFGMGKTVQFGEHGRIHGKPDKADFLPASGLQAVFGQLVGQTEFTVGERE